MTDILRGDEGQDVFEKLLAAELDIIIVEQVADFELWVALGEVAEVLLGKPVAPTMGVRRHCRRTVAAHDHSRMYCRCGALGITTKTGGEQSLSTGVHRDDGEICETRIRRRSSSGRSRYCFEFGRSVAVVFNHDGSELGARGGRASWLSLSHDGRRRWNKKCRWWSR